MKRFLLALLCFTGVISCSRLDIAISWADTYIVSQVDDFFDLTSSQSKALKESIKTDIAKIRKEQFKIWAAELRRLEQDVRKNQLTPESFHNYFSKTIKASQKIQSYFTETAVEFIASVSSHQLEQFERTLRKKNIEYEKKIQNSQKARNETRKKYSRWIDMWIGSLTKDQEKLFNQHLTDHPFPSLAQAKNRGYVLEKFIEARKNPEDLKNFVRNYFTNKTLYAETEYQQALKQYQAELEKFIFDLISTMSDKQKQHLRENLIEKAVTLEKLANTN